jgi:hypothetical protein
VSIKLHFVWVGEYSLVTPHLHIIPVVSTAECSLFKFSHRIGDTLHQPVMGFATSYSKVHLPPSYKFSALHLVGGRLLDKAAIGRRKIFEAA